MATNIYERAIEVLQERGWCKGELRSPRGEVCLLGALREAAVKEYSAARRVAAFRAVLLTLGGSPAAWNDRPERTVEDVILLLKYAAADELETWRELYGPKGGAT